MGNFNEWLSRKDEGFWKSLGQALLPPGPDPEEVAERERGEKVYRMRQWIRKGKQGPPPVSPSDPDMPYITNALKRRAYNPNNDRDDIYGYGAGVNPGA